LGFLFQQKMINLLDKRYNRTKLYLSNKSVKPVYRRRAFPFIDKVLGPQYKWINKTLEEYFGDEQQELQLVIKILSFSGRETFQEVRRRYLYLSRGNHSNNNCGWHPDCGGHPDAFAILNHAYNVFKEANLNK